MDLTFGYFHKNVFPVGFAMSDFHDWKFLAAKVESIVGTEFMFPKCMSKCTSWSATMRGFSTKGVWSNSQTEPKFELWIAHTMLRIVICDDLEW